MIPGKMAHAAILGPKCTPDRAHASQAGQDKSPPTRGCPVQGRVTPEDRGTGGTGGDVPGRPGYARERLCMIA
jgi:hypothetical protein